MSETSGTNNRVIDVLNFLAAHPAEVFTQSELARHLKLSHGSAHRVLKTLTEARYLSRHPKHKTYSLGVAMVAIGQAALERHRGLDIARRELMALADELKVLCLASAVVDDELLTLAAEGMPQTHAGWNRVGERRPFLPPLGLGHIAWAEQTAIAEYLARAQREFGDSMCNYLQTALTVIRQRGYAIAANGEGWRALSDKVAFPLENHDGEVLWSEIQPLIAALTEKEILLVDLDGAGNEGIAFITAPVLAPSGGVAFEITLTGLPARLSVAEINTYAERLRTVAASVTSKTYGRPPAVGFS